jgi:CRISP-associated protein Cas1
MRALSDLKVILHSKRSNIYFLEKCRILQKDGRVLYLTEDKKEKQYWNIPIANTTVLLLGTGTSISQAAVRMLASAGVIIGFSGGGGTPLLMASEVEWLTPQSEYRPTEYIQNWLKFWFDSEKRLKVAKQFQQLRIEYLRKTWSKDKDLKNEGFCSEFPDIHKVLASYKVKVEKCENVTKLLLTEAQFTKSLYKYAATLTKQGEFVRDHASIDLANSFLNHGNYLTYGLASTTLWVLGIPHGFAVMHGKTRRGALVFDVADLIKDALILPWAFISAKENMTEQQFREQCLLNFTEHNSLDFMFESVKGICGTVDQL